jgi:hypothetical protein
MISRRMILAITILATTSLIAAGGVRAETSTTFVPGDPGVRATGMGGAYSAVGGEPIAMYWNPATVFYQTHRAVEASYSDMYGLGIARRTYLTLGFKSIIERPRSEGDRIVVDRDNRSGTAYSLGIQSLFLDLEENGYSEMSIGGAAAWGYGDRLAVGLSFQGLFITSDLDQVSAFGYNLGIGIAYHHAANARIGISTPRLLSRVFWDFDSTERLPFSVLLGWTRTLFGTVVLAADVEFREEVSGVYRAAGGAEWWLARNRLAVRAGYRHISAGIEDVNSPSFGAAFRISALRFDYAYRMENDVLGDTHRLGIMVGF